MLAKTGERSLLRLESWMLAAITSPQGVPERVNSREERPFIHETNTWDARSRMEVYWSAFRIRLQECMAVDYPTFKLAVGDELFENFVAEYLEAHPPQSYTLGRLGMKFPDFLSASRPRRESADTPDWADYLADLARFELTLSEVFDGAGLESHPGAAPSRFQDLSSLNGEEFVNLRFQVAPCLRLLTTRFAVRDHYLSLKQGRAEEPVPASQHMAVTRVNYAVKHYELSRVQWQLLCALRNGDSLGAALEQACEAHPEACETIAVQLGPWFQTWTAANFFQSITL